MKLVFDKNQKESLEQNIGSKAQTNKIIYFHAAIYVIRKPNKSENSRKLKFYLWNEIAKRKMWLDS